MLELKDITKVYPGGEVVEALKGVSLRFRESEFVSILGPSGCGKTTMLNIIGGLDQYTTGELIINGKTTKEYKDRDWDAYRNHSIGFVFQSYNLIPHQSVLQNVELALTLSGVSKSERRKRAKAALEEVGLGDQLRKKPLEMSGGQMQRVAIARAIVNNPDIILADEPTGALDTETSVQVMEILKKISQSRLVIMVTHNPELAQTYSTRIVRMLDGKITSDSAPVTDEEVNMELAEAENKGKTYRKKRPSMSFATSFGLSLKNLFTKKGRTILTSFAGSIGIIGIALIFAVSNGMTTYINTVQEETLSSYPLTIEAQHVDVASLLNAFMGKAQAKEIHENDAVYQKGMLYDMINSLNSLEEKKNDLKAFKKYIETRRKDENSKLKEALSGVQYTYDIDMLIYTQDASGKIIRSDTQVLLGDIIAEVMNIDATANQSMMGSPMGGMMASGNSLWKELLPGDNGATVNDVTKKQYDLVYGDWPTAHNEVVLFLDENNEVDDLSLFALGLRTYDEMKELVLAARDKKVLDYKQQKWTYQEICNMEFRTILNSQCFVHEPKTGTYVDLRETETGLKYLYDNSLKIRVSGIVKPNKDAVSGPGGGGIGYTYKLTEHVINNSQQSEAVKAQLARPSTDVFTGLPFKSNEDTLTGQQKAQAFKEYINSLDEAGKAEAFIKIQSVPPKQTMELKIAEALTNTSIEDMKLSLIKGMSAQMNMKEEDVKAYLDSMSEDELKGIFAKGVETQFRAQYAQTIQQQLAAKTPKELSDELAKVLANYTDDQCAELYDDVLEFSEATYEDNLKKLGCVDLESPATVNLYASSFANKDIIEEEIAEYNKTVDDLQEIRYTDYFGIMMSSITTIINAITYVLISFVAVSLVVSSIMIGVITLISVQERTKEIGILRAIGASKKNVSRMFNAETVIIGFAAGLLGVVVTYLVCIPINLILHAATGINNLNAILPLPVAVVLIVISMLLTLVAGIIPSKSAAKKDPVVALRSE